MRKALRYLFCCVLLNCTLSARNTEILTDSFSIILPSASVTPVKPIPADIIDSPPQKSSTSPWFLIKKIASSPLKKIPKKGGRRLVPAPLSPQSTPTLENLKPHALSETAEEGTKPEINTTALPLVPKRTKLVLLKDSTFKLHIPIVTHMSDDELLAACKMGTLKCDEPLFCETSIIEIKKEPNGTLYIEDMSWRYDFRAEEDQDFYDLVVHKTTATDKEILADCFPPAPLIPQILVEIKKTWYGRKKYIYKDDEPITFKPLYREGSLLLRDGQFIQIAKNSRGDFVLHNIPVGQIRELGYTILYR